jgi:hypothetical protein
MKGNNRAFIANGSNLPRRHCPVDRRRASRPQNFLRGSSVGIIAKYGTLFPEISMNRWWKPPEHPSRRSWIGPGSGKTSATSGTWFNHIQCKMILLK